jgi:aminotransferase
VTGWRIGYAAGPAEVIEKMAVINDLFYICAPAPLQHGVSAGLALPDDYYRRMGEGYRVKRDLLADTLREIGFEPFVPAGSYYIMADFGDRYPDATRAAETILEQLGIATVPGTAFYRNAADGRTQLRFCFAKQMPDLEEACRRLRTLTDQAARTI